MTVAILTITQWKKHSLHKCRHGSFVNRLLIHINKEGNKEGHVITNTSGRGAYYVRNSYPFLLNWVIFSLDFMTEIRCNLLEAALVLFTLLFTMLSLQHHNMWIRDKGLTKANDKKSWCTHNLACCINRKRTMLSCFKCSVVWFIRIGLLKTSSP